MTVVSVEARLEHVTVYMTGARVRRVTTIPAPLPSRVRITGLPLSVIDDTVRVEVGGPALATGVRVGLDAPGADQAAAEEAPELAAARRRAAHADAEVERLRAGLETLEGASVIEPDPSDDPPAAFGAVLAARRALVAVKAQRELAVRAQLAAARREADDAKRALEAAVDRDRRTGSARPARLHELRKHIELELQATAAHEILVHVEYQVAAARWAPSYVARIEGERVKLEVRAVVAQDTGEDWLAVPLRLSTAEPERFSLLPELAPQKIGRRQQEPVKSGFRAPPAGADTLYADYERDLRPRRAATAEARKFQGGAAGEDSTYEGARPGAPAARHSAPDTFATEVWDEESSRGKEAFSTPPKGFQMTELGRGMPPPPPAPQAARKPTSLVLGMDHVRRNRAASSRGEAPADAPAPVVPGTPRLDYGNLVMAPPSSLARGTLAPRPPDRHASAIATELSTAQTRLTTLPLPPGYHTDWTHTYDYAFVTDGAVDVRADGGWHSIPVTAKPGAVKLRHVAVPREQPDVFRVAELVNPLAGPLLPGPIDVYDRGRFLVTSEVDYTPPGAPVEVGLGVDAAVKISRNTEFREEKTGMLGGGLRLHHAITIDVENLSGRAVDLEIRERVPVTREGDDEVEVIAGKVEPAWERWTPDPGAPRDLRLRGGYRWKLALPASTKKTVRAAYEVKIAGKLELIGGNRRES
ncbi:MAG: DUF4139 domain-containing protein [Deltaproteobacteria bacterium]|nr:DUF4139 domain-containing protein [Deltaproteobacteria bacterium]